MVLDKLGETLKQTLAKVAKSMFVDEKLINELVKDIQRALLSADVNVKLVFELTKAIKERALQEKTPPSITKKEHLINIVYEELVKFLGGDKNELKLEKKPSKLMLVGLYGSGKTTGSGKIAKFFSKRGKKVALVQTDIWRPAAFTQLQTLGKQIHVDVFGDPKEKDAVKIYKKFEKELQNYDLIIIDTAGRDALSSELIEEIERVHKAVQPEETVLVISADLGQAAQKQAEQFHKSCGVTGVMITKMDGTAKGGGALSACAITGAPVKFIGVGEKIDDLEQFNPKGFVGRLLGMGDLEALLEKAKEAFEEVNVEDMEKRVLKGDFNFLDLYEQLKAMSKMGSLSKLVQMIPGLGAANIPKEMLEGQEGKLKTWQYVLQSCTKKELEDPELLNNQRIERIAKGSGTSVREVRELLKQYRMAKKMFKYAKGGNMENVMKKMQTKKVKLKF